MLILCGCRRPIVDPKKELNIVYCRDRYSAVPKTVRVTSNCLAGHAEKYSLKPLHELSEWKEAQTSIIPGVASNATSLRGDLVRLESTAKPTRAEAVCVDDSPPGQAVYRWVFEFPS